MSGFISSNMCGLRKLARHPGVFSWLRNQKVVLIQELLQVLQSFRFPSVVRFDVPAVKTGGLRASGGLILLISKDWLGNGAAEILHESSSLLLLRISWPDKSILVGNIYVPVHSESCPSGAFQDIVARVESASPSYPNDGIFIGTSIAPAQLLYVKRVLSFTFVLLFKRNIPPLVLFVSGGDWNAHLLSPRSHHWADQAMTRAHADLLHLGFTNFPTESTPPTYRSALVS